MNELKDISENIQVTYDVIISDKELAGISGGTDIKYQTVPENLIAGSVEKSFDFFKEDKLDKAEKLDYIIAASSGLITGLLDVFWVKDFSFERARAWGKEETEKFVIKAAKLVGCNNDDIKGSIEYLERRYPLPSDGATAETGGPLQHHLRDFSHHPTIAGLLFSVLSQFTGYAYGTTTSGEFSSFKIVNPNGIGNDFSSKVFNGIVNWVFHLISDMAGSSSNPGAGTGIPGPILSLLKEISVLSIIKDLKLKYKNNDVEISVWISKLFNGNFFEGNVGRLKDRDRFDLRFEMGLANELSRQSVPIIINECLVRGFYSVSRLFKEFENKKVESLKDITRINPDNFLPYNSRALTRMITVSSGVFLIADVVGAKINAKSNSKDFILQINYVGIGRFIFAMKADAKYLREDIKMAYDEFMKEHKKQYNENEFIWDGLKNLMLNERQTRILFSLKLQMVLYDINNTKSEKIKNAKQDWLNDWKKAVLDNVQTEESNIFIENENVLYHNIQLEAIEIDDTKWFSLIIIDLMMFKPYHFLGNENIKNYKILKCRSNFLIERLSTSQNLVDKKYIKTVSKTYSRFEDILTNTTKKKVVGVAGTAVATFATGGIALTFAPQIAILLAGGSFAGLSGAALTSASLALIGGGSIAAGGLGMAGGAAIIAGGGALLGTFGSGVASMAILMSSKNFSLQACTKLLTYCDLVKEDNQLMVHQIQKGVNMQIPIMENELKDIEEKINGESVKKENSKNVIKEARGSIKYLKRCNTQLLKMISETETK